MDKEMKDVEQKQALEKLGWNKRTKRTEINDEEEKFVGPLFNYNES